MVKHPPLVLWHRDEEGQIVVEVPALRGCTAHGNDVIEALENLIEVLRVWRQSIIEDLSTPEILRKRGGDTHG